MINRMPQPALVRFAFDKTPHLIHLRGLHAPHFDRDRVRTTPLHHACVDRGEADRFFLIPSAPYSDRPAGRANIPYPTPVERHIDDLLLHSGQAARIGIAPQERPATLVAAADSEIAPCHYLPSPYFTTASL